MLCGTGSLTDPPRVQKKNIKFIANIGDYVEYRNETWSHLDGYVKMVSMRGINVSTDYGDRFVKWDNVINIDKTKQAIWVK